MARPDQRVWMEREWPARRGPDIPGNALRARLTKGISGTLCKFVLYPFFSLSFVSSSITEEFFGQSNKNNEIQAANLH